MSVIAIVLSIVLAVVPALGSAGVLTDSPGLANFQVCMFVLQENKSFLTCDFAPEETKTRKNSETKTRKNSEPDDYGAGLLQVRYQR